MRARRGKTPTLEFSAQVVFLKASAKSTKKFQTFLVISRAVRVCVCVA